MSGPLVSVVIVSWNRRDRLRAALRSVFAQDYSPLEVIVVDGGSCDASAEMVRCEFPAVSLLALRENVGPCAGRNRALESAKGEFIFQIDSDAAVAPASALRAMVDRFGRERDLGVIFPRIEDAAGRAYRPGYGSSHIDDEFYTWRFHGCAAMIRREAIRRAGRYMPEEFYRAAEENDLAVRMLDAGCNILYMPSVVARHEPSPPRDEAEIAYLAARNSLRVAWKFLPVPRAALLTLWRPAHFLARRLARGGLAALPRFVKILAAQFDAVRRRAPVSRQTVRLIDALTLKPAMTLAEMRRLRAAPPRTSLTRLVQKRLGRASL